ncbi:MAG: hypothetical protein K8S98_12350 [Planctomycetes bacterium]|nr:hypothetical protein [Planctomycetota bacterium]
MCALALCGAAASCGDEAPGQSAPSSPATTFDTASDPRLATLFARCEHDGYYDVDTSDPVAILEETLLNGQLDPLKRARVELAATGEPGLAVARRLLDDYLDDPAAQGWARNALDVVSLSKEPAAHELVLRALDAPSEEIRVIALRMMHARGTTEAPEQGRGQASDFDRVLAVLEHPTATTVRDAALVLHDLDAARAEATYRAWIDASVMSGLWQDVAPLFAASSEPETLAWCRVHYRDARPIDSFYFAAGAARAGDAEALEFLRGAANGDDPQRRTLAVSAFAAAKLVDELERVLATETRCDLRSIALREVALAPDTAGRRGVLQQATSDACDEARYVSLEALCARGDERGIDRALGLLDAQNAGDLDLGMRTLRRALGSDTALAERVLVRLLDRHAREAQRPPSERAQLLQSIGQVPLAKATRFLLDLANRETARIQTFEPHRWLCLQAANTGAAGTAEFVAELARERAPVRRIDLLEGLSAPGGEAPRGALLELVQGEALAPHEIVYVADRLVTLGPVARIAPVLKRVTLRVEEPAARRALQCLLWRSYPSKKRG